MQTSGTAGKDPRQDYRERDHARESREPRDKDLPIPSGRADYGRDSQVYRRDSNNGANTGESSGASSYNNNYSPPENYQPPPVGYPQQQQQQQQQQPLQEYSPPSTPTRSQQFPASTASGPQYHFPTQQYGLPSPEPDDFFSRGIPAGPKPPPHSFTIRPVTPPGSDVADSPGGKGKKGKRMSKLKRFSGFGKSKS